MLRRLAHHLVGSHLFPDRTPGVHPNGQAPAVEWAIPLVRPASAQTLIVGVVFRAESEARFDLQTTSNCFCPPARLPACPPARLPDRPSAQKGVEGRTGRPRSEMHVVCPPSPVREHIFCQFVQSSQLGLSLSNWTNASSASACVL